MNQKIYWQPISMLPNMLQMLEGQLVDVTEQRAQLIKCRHQPHVLDNATIQRIQTVYGEQLEFVTLYREQFMRWQAEPISTAQRAEITRLEKIRTRLADELHQVLTLAGELATGTIDAIKQMSDAELGLAFLQGKIKPPGKK